MIRHALNFFRLQLGGWRGPFQIGAAVIMVAYVGTMYGLDVGPVLAGLSGPVAIGIFGLLVLGEDGIERRMPTLPLGPRSRALAESLTALVPIAIGCLLEPAAVGYAPFLIAAAFARSAAPGRGWGATLVLVASSLPAGILLVIEAGPAIVAGVGAAWLVAVVLAEPLLARIARVRDPRQHRGASHRPSITPWGDALRGAGLSAMTVFFMIAPIAGIAAFYNTDSVVEVLCVAALTAVTFAPHGRPAGLPAATVTGSLAETVRRLPVPRATLARVAWILGLGGAALGAVLAFLALFVLDVYNPGGGASIGIVGLQAVVGGALVFVPMTVWRLLGTRRWKLKVLAIAATWGLLLVTALPTSIWLSLEHSLPNDIVFVGLLGPLVIPLIAALASYRDISRAAPAQRA
ncbi:MAG: hypothetical protein GY913_09640 [Proteobacteria bacterium]|nr:hypothetical protein [Pseudomonadota bacterium]MCP4917173.1 hypothetical protein [Pseudomonadota bacterium]